MMEFSEFFEKSFSYLLVGMLWGCTNPFLKKGSTGTSPTSSSNSSSSSTSTGSVSGSSLSATVASPVHHVQSLGSGKGHQEYRKGEKGWRGFLSRTKKSLKKFLKPAVLFPFMLNQSGSLVFYFLLATENISTTVPVCNSLTFIFTGITGWLLGEKFTHPLLFVTGLVMVVSGLSICALSSI
jgi:drug/metabolite transporter (DMT)-like permease